MRNLITGGAGFTREKFDIDFKGDYEHAWFKGKPGFYKSTVSTSSFASEDIVKIRDEIEKKFKNNKFSRITTNLR